MSTVQWLSGPSHMPQRSTHRVTGLSLTQPGKSILITPPPSFFISDERMLPVIPDVGLWVCGFVGLTEELFLQWDCCVFNHHLFHRPHVPPP